MKASMSKLFLPLLAAGLLCSGPTLADDAKPLTKADVEAIVKQVIAENPELLIDSVSNYQKKRLSEDSAKASKNIVERKAELLDSEAPSIGNPNGDVTIVEFFDYHCGYCKQFLPVVTQVVSEDPKLRMVFKEFPILAPDSSIAAKAALAVYSIDKTKYLAYHTALMKMTGSFNAENLADKAESLGIDKAAFKKSLADPRWDKELSQNRELAEALYITGTPALTVGDELVPGVIPVAELKKKIAAVREKAGEQKK